MHPHLWPKIGEKYSLLYILAIIMISYIFTKLYDFPQFMRICTSKTMAETNILTYRMCCNHSNQYRVLIASKIFKQLNALLHTLIL